VDVWIVRDADSMTGSREKACVNEWMYSNKRVHIIRDHPNHTANIMGGMFRAKGKIASSMREMIVGLNISDGHGNDQDFLDSFILPRIKRSMMIHDEFFRAQYCIGDRKFPVERSNTCFVGEIFDEHGQFVREHRRVLQQSIELEQAERVLRLRSGFVRLAKRYRLSDFILTRCRALLRSARDYVQRIASG
jgi:hypothetical protein